jgi:hypothetical protein
LGATGCKDDDGDDTDGVKDGGKADGGGGGTTGGGGDGGSAGGGDAGPKDGGGGGGDAAMDAGPVTIMCGSLKCMEYSSSALLPPTAPGCAVDYNDAEACGLSTANILMGAEPKVLLKDAPGVPSAACAKFLDDREPTPDGGAPDGGTKGDGKINTTVTLPQIGALTLSYPGCCTPKGLCSGDTGKGESMFGASNSGYGCMDPKVFFRSVDGGVAIPCNPQDGGLVAPPASDAGGGDGGASDAGVASDAAGNDAAG